jgi:phospholipid transport system substrate-binding protein
MVTILVLALAGTVGNAPVSSAQQISPVDVVKERNEAVAVALASAEDLDSPEVRERLKNVINGLIDFQELAKRSLGRYWELRTTQEQTEFVDVFRELIRRSSVKKLGIHRADSITYPEFEVAGDQASVTTVAFKGRSEIEIVYSMHRVRGRWMAYDMVIDGASTVRNYRDSFYREIAQTSYEAMYRKLVRRLEEES